MKKILLAITFSLILQSFGLLAQWQSDLRLTNDPAFSYTPDNNAWCVAASANVVHVVWYDIRDGNREIYYKRSADGGASWGADTRLTNNSALSELPSIAVSGLEVHVVWHDARDGNREIYYKRSLDGGVSWEADTRITDNVEVSQLPSVSVSGQLVSLVWQDSRDGNEEIYYNRSTNGGASWGTDTRISNAAGNSNSPSVTVSGLFVHVVWYDLRDGNWEIYYKRSSDGGASWGPETRLTNNAAFSQLPSVAVSGQVVSVLWQDERDGNYEIYYKRSIDGGVSWGADTRLTNNPAPSVNPSVSVSGLAVHVVWFDNRDVNEEIYYKRSIDGGVNWGADTRLTNNTSSSQYSSVAVSGSSVHVVWQDNRDGNYELYYKRDPTGNPIGIININSEIPKEFSLSQNYPNPFNPVTNIEFQIPKAGFVKLTVFDQLGKEVETLSEGNLNAGTYKVDWNAGNYPSGVYFYRLTAENYTRTSKMILIK
ncbi:MAG: exo-alpha-sialidase [Ignavibacteria bacterium]